LVSYTSGLYYSSFHPSPGHDAVVAALAPAEHVALLQWIDAEKPSDTTKTWIAMMQEAAGDPTAARATYEGLAAKLSRDDSGPVPDAVRAGMKRLKK
jgi:hypothetical protein